MFVKRTIPQVVHPQVLQRSNNQNIRSAHGLVDDFNHKLKPLYIQALVTGKNVRIARLISHKNSQIELTSNGVPQVKEKILSVLLIFP